ncbi:TetR/AcrR family transcriptional regulator [Chryseobacterium lathyri]|uniref:TetR/AcrR family transcriptional regulator n=1 Tax=Chryseobacterium lathyri TaxID=395933 RepID=UPI00277D2E9D|nr:TetR/AcrR family transcriptional regulator [Chryseobacterium lathyri]MDQ0064223.1 AcrR family transcriptional regulator [Chryseobacterium lathyri]
MNGTEEKIKKATIDLLLCDGNFGVTMKDIANKSIVSRTVIHYYFRSKENLLAVVCDEIVEDLLRPKYQILFTDYPFKQKILNFIEHAEKVSEIYPYLDIFLVSQCKIYKNLQQYIDSTKESFGMFVKEICEAVTKEEISNQDPSNFIIDLLAISNYSSIYYDFIKKNDLGKIFNSEKAMFKHRKKHLYSYLFSNNK